MCKENIVDKKKAHDLLAGYVFVRQGIKNLILAASLGPVVVLSFASNQFKYYYSGVYEGQGCDQEKDPKNPNHTSLLYGYDFNAETPYMLFKNNWGTAWGDEGYYKVTIGNLEDDNFGHCLIANTPFNTMPIV